MLKILNHVYQNFFVVIMQKTELKKKACFKSLTNPSCIDLLLTDVSSCFQNTCAITTGLSDFHKMMITVMKMTFQKKRIHPKYYITEIIKNLTRQYLKKNLVIN